MKQSIMWSDAWIEIFNMTLGKKKLTYEKSDKNGNAVQCHVKHLKYILNKVQLTLDLCIITRQLVLKEREKHTCLD